MSILHTYRFRMIATIATGVMLLFVIGLFTYIHTQTPRTLPQIAVYAAELGGDYLVRHMHEDGSFVYLYDPETDEELSGYNMLRHAGTAYALLELYGETKEEKYLHAGEKALEHLRTTFAPCPILNEDFTCVYDGEKVKLGGNALAMLAFTEHMRVTGNDRYTQDAKDLSEWIRAMQTKEGEFYIHIQYRDGAVDDHVSAYYPGEAIYALMRLYEMTGQEEFMDSAARAASWLITVRDKEETSDTIAHDHWLLYGLRELYKHSGSELYVNHAKKIVDGIVSIQHGSDVNREWFGGYYNPPRSTPTATRSEGLAAAYTIFLDAAEHEYAQKAHRALERGVIFELRTLIDGKTARSYPNTLGSLGGFRASLVDATVRIDYVQHNISALLGYYKIGEYVDAAE